MINEKKLRLKKLRFEEKVLKEIETKNEGNRNFSLGIIYGLLFGIIGNLYITLLFDYSLKQLSEDMKFILIMIFSVLIIIALLITIKDDRDFKQKEKEINDRTYRVLNDMDRLEEE